MSARGVVSGVASSAVVGAAAAAMPAPVVPSSWSLALTGTTYTDSYNRLSDPAPGGLRRFTASDAQNLDGPPWLEESGSANNYTFAPGVTLSVGAATTKALVKEIAICPWNGGTEASGDLFDPTGFTGLVNFSQWSSMTGSWPASWAAWPATVETFDVGDFSQATGLSGTMPSFAAAPFKDTLTYLSVAGKNCPAIVDIRGLTAIATVEYASENVTDFIATDVLTYDVSTATSSSTIPASPNLLNYDIKGTGPANTVSLNFIAGKLNDLGLSNGVVDLRVTGGTTIDNSDGPTQGTGARDAMLLRGYTFLINP